MTEIVAVAEDKACSNHGSELGLRKLWEQKSSAYEADHPEIAFVVRQVLDMLAKMGI
jgi:hypothetical protein